MVKGFTFIVIVLFLAVAILIVVVPFAPPPALDISPVFSAHSHADGLRALLRPSAGAGATRPRSPPPA